MRTTNLTETQRATLNEARRQELLCEIVRTLDGHALRVERTEEEIARTRSRATLEDLTQALGLRLA